MNESGVIWVVATPIGNLEDLTRRAERVLGEADLIAAEDTRRTRALLSHLGLSKRLISYHDAIESTRAAELVERARAGERIALVSDAGTPLVADPGFRLIAAARAAGVPVVPIPGPSAPIALLSCAGLPVSRFSFLGFLPARGTARRRLLDEVRGRSDTLVFFETARRLPDALVDLVAVLGGDRRAVIGRELTKLFEEVSSGSLEELRQRFSSEGESRLRGEIVVAIAGADSGDEGTAAAAAVDSDAEIRRALDAGSSPSAAVRELARTTGLSRNEIYRRAQAIERERKA